MHNKITIRSLAWPILIETFLRTVLMSADTFMLSRYSDSAAGAVGMVQQFVFFTMMIYMMGATGASILISQNLGAKRKETAEEIGRASLLFNIALGFALSLILRLILPYLLRSLKVESTVEGFANEYLSIYFTFSFFQAISLVLSSILRSHGHSRMPMYVNLGANILNVIGNYIFLFGPFGLPILGVTGVAISTVASQGFGVLVMALIIYHRDDILLFKGKFFPLHKEHIRDILTIGVPSAGETLSYSMAQVALIYLITPMGTAVLASYTYAVNLSRFGYIISLSLGQATQILAGHRMGAGDKDRLFKEVLKITGVGMISSLVCMSIMALFRFPLISLLTENQEILVLTANILLLSVLFELGRPMNLVIISGLKGTGDVRFPVYVGILMMWGISISAAWYMGVFLGWGLIGIWLGRMLDEWLRGFVMIGRWYSRRWESKGFIK